MWARRAFLTVCLSLLFTLAATLHSEAVGATNQEIEIHLHPGWNLVGWLEDDSPIDVLFERLPQLEAVHLQDEVHDADSGLRWSRATEGTDTRVLTGDPMWLLIGGANAVALKQQATSVPPRNLSPGVNAVTWAWPKDLWPGRDLLTHTAWTDAEKHLHPWDAVAAVVGAQLRGFWRWDAKFQSFKLYVRGQEVVPDGRTTRELAPGEAILVMQTGNGSWSRPSGPPILNVQFLKSTDEQALRQAVRDVNAYFQSRLPWAPRELVIRLEHWPGEPRCRIGGGATHVRLYLPCDRMQRLAHQALAPAYAYQYTRWNDPKWLWEGLAGYVEMHHNSEYGIQGYEDARSHLIGVSRSTPLRLSDEALNSSAALSTVQQLSQNHLRRAIGILAIDWLAESYGEEAVSRFIEDLGTTDWTDAFLQAFGRTENQFIADFEAYRDGLADFNGHSPWMERSYYQVVFAGPMTEDRWNLIESVSDIVDAMEARYGVVASAATFVLELSKEEYARAEHGMNPLSCARAPSPFIYALVDCSTPVVIAHEYFHLLQNEVIEPGSFAPLPTWLFEGSADYAALEYTTLGVWEGISDRDEVLSLRREAAATVIQPPTAHQTVAEQAAAALKQSPYMVGESAVRFLVGRVGESALLSALGPKWAEGGHDEASRFESLFDWPLDEFLTEFGTWLLEQKRSR